MQNLTARYNILYNARILIDESERNIFNSYRENFDRLLPVFRESSPELAQAELKQLDKALDKMNVIVNEKSQSQYIDDAYFLIARINHLKGEFFTSAEFFDYVYKTFPEEKELKQAALTWKARALIKLNRFDEARNTVDTALKYINNDKKSEADIYALTAQLAVFANDVLAAAEYLEKAIKSSDDKRNKLRWYYLLGQLQEINNKPEEAYKNYTAVVKSNAGFDLAFNANLNRIAIEDKLRGTNSTRTDRLLALLKEDKNKGFSDQIYYEIANSYLEQNQTEKAIENYNTAIRTSVNNPEQKGLAYLSLAEIYFQQGSYVKSKAYYDSTLLNLTADYPGYEQIKKKGDNLHLLSDRLSVISREDTLQMLARLPEDQRKARIGILARAQARETFAQPGFNNLPGDTFTSTGSQIDAASGGKFYFNNTTAISQGFSEFKRRWGNRKLEDNWRRSQRSSAEVTNSSNATALNPDEVVTGIPATNNPASITGGGTFDIQNIPLTEEQVRASNLRIAQAYFDIGNFYKDILNEPAEAIKAYEELLRRYPDGENRLAVYYNLYRLYTNINAEKADEYKNMLLIRYPESPYAKTILDPNYKQQIDDELQAVKEFYESMYENYLDKKYTGVILQARQAREQFGKNALSSQISYLEALALGHTNKLKVFEDAITAIIADFPDDKLIVPLAEQHLLYIVQNRPELDKRSTVLLDYDPSAPRFVEEPQAQITAVVPAKVAQPVNQSATSNAVLPATPDLAITEPSMFTVSDTSVHYFVVNVLDARVNLNSSRFGIGQFNRANFSGNSIKHRLSIINKENQLIFVGEFKSKDTAMAYYENISPLMKDIMKIPADKYSTFIITKDNLDKLNDRATIDKYIEFYQKNY
ncbi:MAG TPA: tetratricopeptide repeat protein [Sphingobacteriaceae bacterium]